MKISIGSDHAGYLLKEKIIDILDQQGYDLVDHGTNNLDSCDYPDFAYPVCLDVSKGESEKGILVCYTGIGMSMAANKVKGIRAALVERVEDAVLTREHNNANVLCLSAKNLDQNLLSDILKAFLETEFAGGRHERRVNKVMDIENEE